MVRYNFIFNKTKCFMDTKNDLTLIQLAELSGLMIPRFCYHNSLSIAGNCRMCLIEITASLKPVVACGFSLINNININTQTKKVVIMRESVLELLLINHPLDCPICDSGGECDLQDISLLFGNDLSKFKEKKRSVSDKNFGYFIKTIMTRCIHCTRCIRFIDEYLYKNIGGHIGTLGRGVNTIVSNYFNHSFEHDLSGNLSDLCPVGALTHKTYAFTARPWELNSYECFDVIENVSMNIRIDTKGNDVYRILPIYTKYIDDEFISNKTRYFYDTTFITVTKYPMLTKFNFIDHITQKISWNFTLTNVENNSNKYTQMDITSYDLHTMFFYKIYHHISEIKNILYDKIDNTLRTNYIMQKNIIDLVNKIIFLYFNIKYHSTIMNLKFEKLNIKLFNIGVYDEKKTQLGINQNYLIKFLQKRVKNNLLKQKQIHDLMLYYEENKSTKNIKNKNMSNYLTTIDNITFYESGISNSPLRSNKHLKNVLYQTYEVNNTLYNEKKEYQKRFNIRTIKTHFIKDYLKNVKYDKISYSYIFIPINHILNQTMTFRNIFGYLKYNHLVIKSTVGFDDFSVLAFFFYKKIESLFNKINHDKHMRMYIYEKATTSNTLYLMPNIYSRKKGISLIKIENINIKQNNEFHYYLPNIFNFQLVNNYIDTHLYTKNSKYLKNGYLYDKLHKPTLNINYFNKRNIITYSNFEKNNNFYSKTQQRKKNFFDYFRNNFYENK